MFFAQFSYETYYFEGHKRAAFSQVLLFAKNENINATINYIGTKDFVL